MCAACRKGEGDGEGTRLLRGRYNVGKASNRRILYLRHMQRVFVWLGVLLLMTVGSLQPARAQTPGMARGIALNDLAHRDVAIHWPEGFDPATAAQFSHNELLIPAPCEHVFAQMANVTAWPEWFILVKDVRVEGPNKTPGRGRTLSLSIFNTPITAKITEWVLGERLSWEPETVAPSGSSHYHAWHFLPIEGGCRAVTEEVGIGPADKKSGAEGSFYMHRAHDLWLASLRYASE